MKTGPENANAQRMYADDLAAMDHRFAEVAIAKGYLTIADLTVALGKQIYDEGAGCCRETLPSLLLRQGLMTWAGIDLVLEEMFDAAGNLISRPGPHYEDPPPRL